MFLTRLNESELNDRDKINAHRLIDKVSYIFINNLTENIHMLNMLLIRLILKNRKSATIIIL